MSLDFLADLPGEPAGAPQSTQAASGQRRREGSTREILDATSRLLARGDAVARLSVSRIIEEAGVSRATFYACFSDKHAVIAQLAGRSLAWRNEVSGESLGDADLTRDRLDELMRTIVGHWRANRAVLGALVELAEHDPEIGLAWRSAVGQIAAQTAAQLDRRWAGSPDAPADPGALAEAFTWMFERCCHQLVVDDASAERTALALSEIIWRTIAYRAPR